MHEASRSKADLAMNCYSAFLFALKAVSSGIDREFTSDEYMRIWAVVRSVADGQQTLNVSPAELQAAGEMLPAMRDNIQQTTQTTMRAERELAARLLRAADGFVVRDDAL